MSPVALRTYWGGLIGPVTDGAVEMLSWLATQHPQLDSPIIRGEAEELSAHGIRGIYTWGINTARGKAAEAVGKLIWRDADNIASSNRVIGAMLREQHPGVVSCVGAMIAAGELPCPACGMRLLSQVQHGDGLVFATPHFLTLLAAQLPERFEAFGHSSKRWFDPGPPARGPHRHSRSCTVREERGRSGCGGHEGECPASARDRTSRFT